MTRHLRKRHRASKFRGQWKGRQPLAAGVLASALACASMPAAAVGSSMGTLDIVTRADGGVLTTYGKGGRHWVVGTPGQEYSLRVCNTTGGRILTVMSVDGINVITGETASPAQSGYVLNARECADVGGWRKSLAQTAAFYFADLPDSYAARTGRAANAGVIGVAFFRERPQPIASSPPVGKIAASRGDEPASRQETATGATTVDAPASAEAVGPREDAARVAPAPLAKLGTGHGRSETSLAQVTHFERESAYPTATITLQYDRRENLVAMGVLPAPTIARMPAPFPGWLPRFTPDPPAR